MYAGRIVETGPVDAVFSSPQHPYTQRLLESLPVIGGARELADPDPRRPAGAGRGPGRLRVPAALPARRGDVPGGAGAARGRARPVRRCHFAPWERWPEPVIVGRCPDDRRDGGPRDLRGALRRRAGRSTACRSSGGRGEILGVVGESGCGKSTLARALLGLVPAGGGLDRAGRAPRCSTARACGRCAGAVQMIFQDPYQTLNPRRRVRDDRDRAARRPGRGERRARGAGAAGARGGRPRARRASATATRTSSPAASASASRSPPRSCSSPAGIVCDEPVSMLDVSVRAQILQVLLRAPASRAGWRCCSSPTTCRSPGGCATGSRSCTSAGSSSRATRAT